MRATAIAARGDLIFDIGCHRGEDTAFYLRKGFRVLAVEANPNLCAEIRQQFAREVAEQRLILVEKAIASPGTKQVSFFEHEKETLWGTTRRRRVSKWHNFKTVYVPTISLASLLSEFGAPHYLKIDIEGSDWLCLKDLLSFAERPCLLSIEHNYKNFFAALYALQLLLRLGYDRFQIVDQARVHEQIEPKNSREGRYVGTPPLLGSSGLFGSDLPRQWCNRRGIILLFLSDYFSRRLGQIHRRLTGKRPARIWTWYDLHAADSDYLS
jgi:FkbM family methyltransferase